MTTELDSRGVPPQHMDAQGAGMGGFGGDDWRKGPALDRHENALYSDLPSPPDDVVAAREAMDSAAALVYELDRAARKLLAEYHAAPRRARVAARDAVARGEAPPSTSEVDAERDQLARKYKDAVAHRVAVEDHLSTLVARYHRTAEAAFTAWRDQLAAQLDERAATARTALASALAQAREAVALAVAVEQMDRPVWDHRNEAPRVSALEGKDLPEHLRPDPTRGQGGTHFGVTTADVDADLDAVARLATRWLRVEGNHQLGQGAIPECLVMQTVDMPERTTPVERFDPEAASRAAAMRKFVGELNMLHGA